MQSDSPQPEEPAGSPIETPEITAQKSRHRRLVIRIATALGLVLLIGGIILWTTRWRDEATRSTQSNTPPSTSTPVLKTETVLSGRRHVWEIAFIPSGSMLFTERGGTVSTIDNGVVSEVARISDVRVAGEGGLLGLAIDPDFAKNRYIYTCFNTDQDVRIVRWKLAEDLKSLQDRNDIVTGIPSNVKAEPGRHSGCRIGFGADGYLWAGTGDTAQGDIATQPKSLGGKVLRVDHTGQGAPGNLGGEFDSRIFSYGHRNIQGIAFFAEEKHGTIGLSVEHGPGVDDEINELKLGDFGWAPPAGEYSEENVPMTDTVRFPDAIRPIWASGAPTQAPSGATILKGAAWEGWNGAIAVGFLKAEHLKILRLDASNQITKEERLLSSEFGRLRAVAQGLDGSLYVGTSNGSDDKILKLTPKQ